MNITIKQINSTEYIPVQNVGVMLRSEWVKLYKRTYPNCWEQHLYQFDLYNTVSGNKQRQGYYNYMKGTK